MVCGVQLYTKMELLTHAAFRAAAHVFQKPMVSDYHEDGVDPQICNTSLATYVGLDKREGLTKIGRRLLNGISVSVSCRYRGTHHS